MAKPGIVQSSKLVPGAGVPVKVGVPIACVNEGTSVTVVGSVAPAGQPSSGPIELTLAYDNVSDWENPPATMSVTAPPDAQGARAFTLRLVARNKTGLAERNSNVTATVKGTTARTVIEVLVRP